jgi:hypothetical protein
MSSTGQVLMESKDISAACFTFDVSQQAKGLYFVEVSMGDKVARTKLVKVE